MNPILVQIVVLTGVGFMVYFLVRTVKLAMERRILQREYEGRMAVGRELDQLVPEGHHVYHDVPAENSNIDHIVVGRSGIFAVETSTRSKPAASNRTEDATVEYNGKILIFPNGDDCNTIAEAERQASWISDWIVRATGEQVAARAIVALPDWFVKRTSADGISVVNPKQFPSLFKHIKPRFLTDETINRIVDQLEQKCRNVKPASESQDEELS
ncbi:MAG: NERD domain-containing protein [Desulfobacterales bacterium]|nr:MAG: NERD domain-containing protein [Desulfobacterales bacterium]